MANCNTCPGKGRSQSSLEKEREREARNIERRKMNDANKAAFADRRAKLIATVREQREQARNR